MTLTLNQGQGHVQLHVYWLCHSWWNVEVMVKSKVIVPRWVENRLVVCCGDICTIIFITNEHNVLKIFSWN